MLIFYLGLVILAFAVIFFLENHITKKILKWGLLSIILVVVVITIIAVALYNTNHTSTIANTNNTNSSWHIVLAMSGNNPKTSDIFKIQGQLWKITYQVSTPTPSWTYGQVTINVHGSGSDIIFASANADQYKIENGPGTFYVDTDPTGGVSYTITVQDYY